MNVCVIAGKLLDKPIACKMEYDDKWYCKFKVALLDETTNKNTIINCLTMGEVGYNLYTYGRTGLAVLLRGRLEYDKENDRNYCWVTYCQLLEKIVKQGSLDMEEFLRIYNPSKADKEVREDEAKKTGKK